MVAEKGRKRLTEASLGIFELGYLRSIGHTDARPAPGGQRIVFTFPVAMQLVGLVSSSASPSCPQIHLDSSIGGLPTKTKPD